MEISDLKSRIRMAVELARPTAEKLLIRRGAIFGPKYLAMKVGTAIEPSGFEELVIHLGDHPSEGYWNQRWGGADNYMEIARYLFKMAIQEGLSTRQIAIQKPQLVVSGKPLLPGGVYSEGVAAAVFGAKSWLNEAVAKTIVDLFTGLSHEKAEEIMTCMISWREIPFGSDLAPSDLVP
jgi:hypothetical protein